MCSQPKRFFLLRRRIVNVFQEIPMRTCFVGMFAALLAMGGAVAVASADDVEIKGAHLCCAQCVKIANALLTKVDGLSDISADAKSRTITFKSKDEAGAKAGIKAIIDGGFF